MKRSAKKLILFFLTILYIYISGYIIRLAMSWINSASFTFSDLPGTTHQWRKLFFPAVCYFLAFPIGFVLMHQFNFNDFSRRFQISPFWLSVSLLPLLLQISVYYLPFPPEWTGMLFNISVYFPTIPLLNGLLSGFCLAKGLFRPPTD